MFKDKKRLVASVLRIAIKTKAREVVNLRMSEKLKM